MKFVDEGIQLGDSPATYWNVENGVIHSISGGSGKISENSGYFSRDDFDSRLATTAATQGSNVQATLMAVTRNQSTSGVSSVSENQVSGIRSVTYPTGMPSQSVIQDRLLRDGHFTSSPKLDKTRSETIPDNSQDISLVSSISAPFELRPKAYDDTVINEQTTFVDESDGENLNAQVQRLYQSDGAAQLISMRQSQSTNMTNPAMLPHQPGTSVPSSREQVNRPQVCMPTVPISSSRDGVLNM